MKKFNLTRPSNRINNGTWIDLRLQYYRTVGQNFKINICTMLKELNEGIRLTRKYNIKSKSKKIGHKKLIFKNYKNKICIKIKN